MSNNFKVPETDEEVIKKFKEMFSDEQIIISMIGIFECRRLQGESLIEAYQNTLKTYIKNTDSKHLVQ